MTKATDRFRPGRDACTQRTPGGWYCDEENKEFFKAADDPVYGYAAALEEIERLDKHCDKYEDAILKERLLAETRIIEQDAALRQAWAINHAASMIAGVTITQNLRLGARVADLRATIKRLQAFNRKYCEDNAAARGEGGSGECDCQSPDTNPAGISNSCPEHNLYPITDPDGEGGA